MYDGIQLSEAIVKFLNNQVQKENGYLIEPKDVESLKIGLDFFRENTVEVKRYAIKALEIVHDKYNVDYVSNLFVNDLLSQ